MSIHGWKTYFIKKIALGLVLEQIPQIVWKSCPLGKITPRFLND